MASYTMELRNYIEMWTQDDEELSHRDRIEVGRKHLFDFPYPIWDEAYRKEFETKFIRHFYMREIGFETEELFKMRLENWLAINMPYFNNLLESELLQNGYDPLTNTKINTKHNKKNDLQQDDIRDRTQNMKEDEGITQNVKSDEQSSFSTNEQSETNRTLDRTENTDQTSTSETDTTRTENQDTTSNGETFNRQLKDNTPDGRLGITANDGTGVINYASTIEENKGTTKDSSNQETKTTESSTTDTTSSQDVTGKDTEKITSTTDTTGNSQTDTNQDTTSDRDLNRNTVDKDTLDRDIKRNEDFIEDRFGKIGINAFGQLLREHRKTFMRVERDIFIEMERLFMGIY